MSFENLQAAVSLLLENMESQPEDRRELALQLLEKLNEMKAYGMPLPDDLVALEASLEAEFNPPAG